MGGHIYAISGCKADWVVKGQNYTVSGDIGFGLREGHWRKPLHSFEC